MDRRSFIKLATAAIAATQAPALAASVAQPGQIEIRVIELPRYSAAQIWILHYEERGQIFRKDVRVSDREPEGAAEWRIARKARELKADVLYSRDQSLWESSIQKPPAAEGVAYRLSARDLSDVAFV